MYEPMLAVALDIDKVEMMVTQRDYWMEPKLDGVRCIVAKYGDKVSLTSRGNKTFNGKFPHLEEMFLNIPGDFVLDGELGYYKDWDRIPIIDFNRTMRVVGSGTEVAVQKQNREYLTTGDYVGFFAFDMLMLGGLDLSRETNYRRRALLAAWRNEHNRRLVATYFDLTALWGKLTLSTEDLLETYADYVARGGEGMMFKNPTAPYHSGKRRANTWYKLKAFETVDVKITGSIPGQGKYTDQVGAVTFVDPETGRTGKCSGMDDETRILITNNLPALQGRYMEIRFFGLVGREEEGFRHPQFVRFRPDKDT